MNAYNVADKLEKKSGITVGGGKNVPDGYGICSKCSEFEWTTRQYGEQLARCRNYDFTLTRVDVITDCSGFFPRGQMDLRGMVGIATIIDVKPKIGFSSEVEITVTPPEGDGEYHER